jgi:O-methyltransferase involved in polyketide biosynthesis
MTKTTSRNLSNVSESLIIPLYIRALETVRPDALLKDEWAVKLIHKLNIDEEQFTHAEVSEDVQVSILLRNRQFDHITKDFLTRYAEASVVYLGCGLDTRFMRVDNGQVEWYDLDLPEVIGLRRELISDESGRYHLLACSALDPTWMDVFTIRKERPFLFLAEGLFMFFEELQVISLVMALKNNFPGSELVFDAFSPFYVWGNNRRVVRTKIGAMAHWALKHPTDLEHWTEGIRLLDEWYPFLAGEPRLAHLRWVRFIPLLSKTTGIFYYQLSKSSLD